MGFGGVLEGLGGNCDRFDDVPNGAGIGSEAIRCRCSSRKRHTRTKESESTITRANLKLRRVRKKAVETKKLIRPFWLKKVLSSEDCICSYAGCNSDTNANEVLTAVKAVLANETANRLISMQSMPKLKLDYSCSWVRRSWETSWENSSNYRVTVATIKLQKSRKVEETKETVEPVQEAKSLRTSYLWSWGNPMF